MWLPYRRGSGTSDHAEFLGGRKNKIGFRIMEGELYLWIAERGGELGS